jgi:secreted Zn-dependent insulinase-like peptidase
MKWELTSADQFIEAKEYIDTAIVPLIKIELGEQYKPVLKSSTWITGVASGIESKLMGRVMLFPVYSYTGLEKEEHLIANLYTYVNHLQQHGLKNVIFLTHNQMAKSMKEHIIAEFLSVAPENIDSLDITSDEILKVAQEMAPKIIAFWKKG